MPNIDTLVKTLVNDIKGLNSHKATFAALCLILFTSFPAVAQISSSQFVQNMMAHRQRLQVMGALLLRGYSQVFSEIQAPLLREYLTLHDHPKMENLEELRAHGYTGLESISQRLAQFYGSNKRTLQEKDLDSLNDTILWLNKIEHEEKMEFFKKHQISQVQIQQLMEVEHIADLTDTGMARRVEMGAEDKPYDGERFFLSHNDLFAAKISHWLEDSYNFQYFKAKSEPMSCKFIF